MDLISQVILMGGACTRASLVRARGSAEVDAALSDGILIRTARGRYALSSSHEAVKRASGAAGILSHRSAALHWGWAQKIVPLRPEVTVPRNRRVTATSRELIVPHWADLGPDDVTGLVTTPRRTLVDCMRNLPLDEAMAIVDSAVRAGDFTQAEVMTIADSTRGRGRARIRGVAAGATSRSANPFESVIRAQANLVPGLDVQAQLAVPVPGTTLVLHPDLADARLGIAVEAESFEWHGTSAALTRDCRRYNTFTQLGWLLVRFSWYQVMFEPAYVHRTLIDAVALARRHANVVSGTQDRPAFLSHHIRMSGGAERSSGRTTPPGRPLSQSRRIS